MNLVMRY